MQKTYIERENRQEGIDGVRQDDNPVAKHLPVLVTVGMVLQLTLFEFAYIPINIIQSIKKMLTTTF